MRLISFEIENFGGLSGFSLNFEEELTVVKGANGSGKTTIAEFIRAMFYGFPRKNSNDLSKDIRRKYNPWQGGNYGGSLTFEQEGVCYRMERTFGRTPQSDTFKLYELDPLRESSRFSKNIGKELFQLDSDSFERSIYFSQIHDNTPLSTADIQAKLGNLVEDADDIGSFDKAKDLLRKKRSSLISFRGGGGSVEEAQTKISKLVQEIEEAEQKAEDLVQAEQSLSELTESRTKEQEELGRIRNRIRILSEESAEKAKQEQYQKLCDQIVAKEQERQKILTAYPAGIPDESELNDVQNIADQMALLNAASSLTQTEKEATDIIEKLGGMFTEGIPTEQDLKQARENYNEYIKVESILKSQKLSDKEQSRLHWLEDFFAGEVPDDDSIADMWEEEELCEKLRLQEEEAVLSEEDVRQLEEQENFFSDGIPEKEELDEAKSWASRIKKLSDEATGSIPERMEEENSKSSKKEDNAVRKKLFLPFLIIGLAAFLGGIGCFIAGFLTPGMITFAVGLLLIIGALYLNLSQAVNRWTQGNSGDQKALRENREKVERNRREIEELSQKLEEFLSHYGDGHGSYEEQLAEIGSRLPLVLSLQTRKETTEKSHRKIHQQQEAASYHLLEELQKYFPEVDDLKDGVSRLDSYQKEYNRLKNHKEELAQESRQTESTLRNLEEELTAFLVRYDPSVTPDQFDNSISALSRNVQNYKQALAQENERAEKEKSRIQSLEEYSERVNIFIEQYQLALNEFNQEAVRRMREDASNYNRISGEISSLEAERNQFYEKNKETLMKPSEVGPKEDEDIESLKEAEKGANDTIDMVNRQITEMEQSVRLLRRSAEELPEKQDELERWQEKKKTELHQAEMLDRTINLLETAKDALNNRYLGPIRKQFDYYMGLLGDIAGEGEVFIDPNLTIKLERSGGARELAFFSAGQTDIIMLCMRIALVDALYQDAKPLLILDDPFVNLDDENMKEAMTLLDKLSVEHQILYLVCSETRVPRGGVVLPG